MASPAWLGIGAQRSGTTWFTDLLTQHPQVGLGTNGKKEQHLLHKVADGREPPAAYLDLFPDDDGVRRGEWTPQSLRHASAPAAAAPARPGRAGAGAPARPGRAVPVRDAAARDPAGRDREVVVALPGADHGADVHRLLRRPARGVGAPRRPGPDARDGLRGRPGATPRPLVDAVWRLLGLEPVVLRDVESASGSSSQADWDWPEGLKESLEVLYAPQVARLADEWGLDLSVVDDATPVAVHVQAVSSKRPVGQPRPAQLAQLGDLLRRPGRQVVADRAGRLLVGRPPVLERLRSGTVTDSSPPATSVRPASSNRRDQVALARAGRPPLAQRVRVEVRDRRPERRTADLGRRRGPRRRRPRDRRAGSPGPSRPALEPGPS